MEFLLIFVFLAVWTVGACSIAYGEGKVAGTAEATPPLSCCSDLDPEPGDLPDQEPVVFGNYCLMEHKPWESQKYWVYRYDDLHAYSTESSAFGFNTFGEAIEYMSILDERAKQHQRRDNLLNHLDADFGVPKVIEWDYVFDILDDEEAPGVLVSDGDLEFDDEETLS